MSDVRATDMLPDASELRDPLAAPRYRIWHFDALSDDGREAVSIEFVDNCRLSPVRRHNGGSPISKSAVSFVYSVEGKTVARVLTEFDKTELATGGCKIGGSTFEIASAEYGSGVLVHIELARRRGHRVSAEMEWLDVESGHASGDSGEGDFNWNIVAPRSDVSGRIKIAGKKGDVRKLVHFRGTGYHDEFCLDETMRSAGRCWGRAHFVDATAIFHHLDGGIPTRRSSKIYLERDGKLHERSADFEMLNIVRDRYGMRIPQRLTFTSDDNIRVRVKPVRAIRSGFFDTKLVSEITLSLRDGKPRKTLGVTEFWEPSRLNKPLLRFADSLWKSITG